MRHQFDYADSLHRAPSAVLGLPLRPYSIGMELELLRARSPFTTARQFSEITGLEKELLMQALIFAADACSQSELERIESSRLLNAASFPWWDRKNRRKKKQIALNWKKWDALLPRFDFDQQAEKFWIYLCAGKTGPEFAKSAGDGPATPIGAPEMCLLLNFVRRLPEKRISEWGSSELDFPVSIARYEYYTLLESTGKVSLKSDFVETLDDIVAENEAKIASGEVSLEAEEKRIIEEMEARAAWNSCQTPAARLDVLKNHPRILNISADAVQFVNDEAVSQGKSLPEPA